MKLNKLGHKFSSRNSFSRCDEETGEPIRNSGGTCIRCKPGEAGVFVGKINAKKPSSAFGGYADKVNMPLTERIKDILLIVFLYY